jgi:hypothetical protein
VIANSMEQTRLATTITDLALMQHDDQQIGRHNRLLDSTAGGSMQMIMIPQSQLVVDQID